MSPACPIWPPLRAVAIRQGYITRPDDSCEVRLRQKDGAYLITIKGEAGLVREEHEAPIPKATFDVLWQGVAGSVEKTRHIGALENGLIFELDVFEGPLAPLTMVEVEFDSEEAAHAFVPPEWFGQEVTAQRAYSNRVMAFRTRGVT
ncbi:CYTH domain-containing protein [Pseudooceanicola sp. 502str34]